MNETQIRSSVYRCRRPRRDTGVWYAVAAVAVFVLFIVAVAVAGRNF